jgi:hypothetical protein
MSPSLDILSDPVFVKAHKASFTRLDKVFQGCLKEPFYLSGICHYREDVTSDWEDWLDLSLANLAQQAQRSLESEVFRPLCLNYNPRGVHFVDHLFGASVFRMEDGSWQANALNAPIGRLEKPDIDSHPAWIEAQDVALAFIDRKVPAVLFGLPTIASVLNIAVNLYGQEILVALKLEPDAARHDLDVISCVLCSLHGWYLENLPLEQMQCILPHERCQPPGYGQFCGCTTQLISAKTYAEWIAPYDERLLSLYPNGGMIHLCGSHSQHIPTWRTMGPLKSVQLNDRAASDLALYREGLRQDQILYVMPNEDVQIPQILDITGGERLVIQGYRP